MKKGFVYIMSNKSRTTFYIGVTHDIKRRVLEHKTRKGSAFTTRYSLCDLVYYEIIDGMDEAIAREKQIKNWHRDWKINLIRGRNPMMEELSEGWYEIVDGELIIKDRIISEEVLKQVQDDFVRWGISSFR